MITPCLTLGGRFVFPVEGAPIAGGSVTIKDGTIAWVGPSKERRPDLDLGNVAITPGFVNAHTHLELAALDGDASTLGEPEDEIAWLRRVVDQRRRGTESTVDQTVRLNLEESVAAGTTLLADTTTAGLSWNRLVEAPIRAVVFAELIGLKRTRGLETSAAAWDWLATVKPDSRIRPGLSPHAPYSTSGWLYHRAAGSGLPLSTHLAEMPEERELLERGDGPLRRFLEDLGAWDDAWDPVGPRPTDYIRQGDLRNADWLVAHGTYIDPADFWQLRPEAAAEGHRSAVAFCPRTHARFGHAPHPFRGMLERGVVVCLGTDSRASSPSLSVLDEARFLRSRDETLSGQLLLAMGTHFGAWALRAEATTGSLKVGKSADLAVVALPDCERADPHDLLFDSDLPVVASFCEGQVVSGQPIGM